MSNSVSKPVSGKVVLWSVTSALAGFLFGFDTVVISGAEKTIQTLWHLSDGMHGLAMGIALWGTVVGALIGGWPTDKVGRKKTLLLIGVLYVISALGCAFAPDVYSFMVARFIGGLGIGMSTIAAPLYISEIAPPQRRGLLAGMFQFNIVFGILVAYASNAALAGVGENSWRWMLGVPVIPSIIYVAMCLVIPESPRWLIGRKNDRAAGLRTLGEIYPGATEQELAEKADVIAAAAHDKGSTSGFWSMRLRVPILLAFLVAFFNQLSGINAILYFAPRIFEWTGLGPQAALLQSIGIGVTNLIFTFIGLWLIDRLGRRTLLYIGSFGYIASLGLCAWAFFSGHFGIVPACIFAFIAAHAVGQGAVIWVLISEIFPSRHRAEGQALGSSTHWVFAALLTTFFPWMVKLSGAEQEPSRAGYIFSFFGLMMVLQLIWVKVMVPETKGRTLEDIEAQLSGAGGR
jgi:sugar porter (SP) family MFS transporter